MRKTLVVILMVIMPGFALAQFAPAQDKPGTTAMHADSSAFVAWATGCTVERGPKRIDQPDLGYADYGNDTLALGVPGGTFDVVSLGDGGVATLTFASPICNGEGPDFAVFENGFANAQDPDTWALELGFVEVSSDGVNFFRFPAVTQVQAENQFGNAGSINPAQLHNFSSKYGAFYGTPFDLDELEDNPLLNKNHVTHIRIVDVVGCIQPEYASYDAEGHVINDPWPTPFGSSGFDLDAVGVIHDLAHYDVPENGEELVSLYPNPVKDRLFVKTENLQLVEVYNAVGQLVMITNEEIVDLTALTDGMYLVRIVCESGMVTKRIVKQ